MSTDRPRGRPSRCCYCYDDNDDDRHPQVPYKGPVAVTLLDLYGGLRSACTYVGAATLAEIERRTTFIRVSQQVNTIFTGREM